MQTLVNDIEQPKTSSPLDELLKDYQSPLVVSSNPSNGSQSKPETINPNLSNPLNNVINQGEQRFYKTGKKAGQPKPNRVGSSFNSLPQNNMQTPLQNGPAINSQLISGALFITLIDLVLPVIICFVNNRFSKAKLKPETLKLDETQKKEMEKLADEVVKQLNLRANPAVLFTVSLGGIYAMNFMLQKSLAEVKKPVNPYDK